MIRQTTSAVWNVWEGVCQRASFFIAASLVAAALCAGLALQHSSAPACPACIAE